MSLKHKIWGIVLLVLTCLFFGLPNIINQREKEAFNNKYKFKKARELFEQHSSDTIQLAMSNFYGRNNLAHILLGKHHRKLWTTPVNLPVFNGYDSIHFLKTGGGQQTKSVEVKNTDGQHFAFRSINKDNSNVLPDILKYSFLRPFLRDQACAMNPYAAPVASSLMSDLGIWHPKAEIYIIPYRQNKDSLTLTFAGQGVLLEEEIDKSWKHHPRFDSASRILKTTSLLEKVTSGSSLSIDTIAYIRCRLFDFLISDWDRHERQWKWLVFNGKAVPVPIDRDMAFCKYDDGMASKLVRVFNNKFQSFTKDEYNIEGLTRNSLALDKRLVKGIEEHKFIEQAEFIQKVLTENKVREAFVLYPPEIYEVVGEEHIDIFIDRKERLKDAALAFYELLNNE